MHFMNKNKNVIDHILEIIKLSSMHTRNYKYAFVARTFFLNKAFGIFNVLS